MTTPSGVLEIDALLNQSGHRLNPTFAFGQPAVITYSFLPPSNFSDPQNYRAFTDTQKEIARNALKQFEKIAGLRFVENTTNPENADIGYIMDTSFAQHNGGDASGITWSHYYSYDGNGAVIGKGTLIDLNSASSSITSLSAAGLTTLLLHESGHALGLKHPGDYDAIAGTAPGPFLPAWEDNDSYTVMSYVHSVRPQTLMPLDVQALQFLYGKPAGDNTFFSARLLMTGTTTTAQGTNFNEIIDVGSVEYVGMRNAGQWFSYNSAGKYYVMAPRPHIIDGAGGTDIVKVAAASNTATFSRNSDGTIQFKAALTLDPAKLNITLSSGANPSTYSWKLAVDETLINVERIQFTDKTIAFDTAGDAGQAYRLYQAALGRKPDSSGLGYWTDHLDHGVSLVDIASGFFNSAEFKGLYGTAPTNTELVTRFYQNVLHRAPERAGLDWWLNELATGHQSPQMALIGFSESPENQAQLIGVIQNGMEYTIGT
jgi:serralysin